MSVAALFSLVPLVANLAGVAQNAWDPTSDPRPDTLELLVRDLEGADGSRRRYAIRELNRVARLSRKAEFGPLDDERTTDALSNLSFLDEAVAGVCIAHIAADIEVAGCARLLARLETMAARPVLSDALRRADSRRAQKALRSAIAVLESAALEGP